MDQPTASPEVEGEIMSIWPENDVNQQTYIRNPFVALTGGPRLLWDETGVAVIKA